MKTNFTHRHHFRVASEDVFQSGSECVIVYCFSKVINQSNLLVKQKRPVSCQIKQVPKRVTSEAFPNFPTARVFAREHRTDHEYRRQFYLPKKYSNVHAEVNFQCLLLQSKVFFLPCDIPPSFRRLLLLRESVTSRTGSSSLWKTSGQDGGLLFFALRKYIHIVVPQFNSM